MAKYDKPVFHGHHVIEQDAYKRSKLLQDLSREGLFNLDGDRNLLNLPADKQLALRLEVGPHNGGPLGGYSDGLTDRLENLADSPDGQAALAGDRAAAERIAARVNRLCDTLKVGMVNGDLLTNTPEGMAPEVANAKSAAFFESLSEYQHTHTLQIDAVGKRTGPEARWPAVLKSEASLTASIEVIDRPGSKTVKGNAAAGQQGLVDAVERAQADGRLTLSEPGAAAVEAFRGPRNQRGFIAPELLGSNLPPGARLAGAAGAAVVAYEGLQTYQRHQQLQAQGSPLAAQSEANHYLARMLGAAVLGTTGAVLGSAAGPGGTLAGGVAGGLQGETLGERSAVTRDNTKIDHHTLRGVDWEFNGRTWTRAGELDATPDAVDNPRDTRIVASFEQMRELNALASAKAVELAMGKVPAPSNPFRLPANDSDPASLSDAPWQRDAHSGQWHRTTKTGVSGENNRGEYTAYTATPERAAQLDAQAAQVIWQNLANSPANLAAQYQLGARRNGFEPFAEAAPQGLRQALDPDRLQASNKVFYTRNADGAWMNGQTRAEGILALELEATRSLLQASLAEHRQQLAAIPNHAERSPELKQQDELVYRYRVAGIELPPDMPEAIALATQRTRQAHGLSGDGVTQLDVPKQPQVQHDAAGQIISGSVAAASVPIIHYQRDANGVYQPVTTTSTADILQAREELQARKEQAPTPDTPQLHIAQHSPQQRDAQAQATREANRQGLSQTEVAQVATLAAVQSLPRTGYGVTAPRLDHAEPNAVLNVPEARSTVPAPPTTPADQAATAVPTTLAAQQAQMLRQTLRSSEPQSPDPQPSTAAVSPTPNAPSQATTATPTPTEPSEIEGLRLGDSGNDVAFLQHRLKQAGATGTQGQPVPQDGQFGVDTDHAVRQVQQAQGLPATGVADAAFDNALAQAQQARIPLSPTFEAQVQQRQEQERQAQEQQAREARERQLQEQRERETQEREALQRQQQVERERLAQERYEAEARSAQERTEDDKPSPETQAMQPAPERDDLRLGNQGTDVAFLQHRLHKAGMTGQDGQPIPQDGSFGPDTDAAVRQFQQANGLPVTGVADQEMNNALVQQERVQSSRSQPAATAAATPAPSTPQPTIEPLSPEQQQAQTQAIGQAQRQGASQAEVQQVAAAAAASVGKTPEQSEAEADLSSANVESAPRYAGRSLGGPSAGRQRDEREEAREAPVAEKQHAQTFPTDHRDYALFAAIQAGLPKGTPDEKTAELLYAAKVGGLDGKIIKFDRVSLDGDKAYVYSPTPGKGNATGLSLSAPAPSLEETLRNTQDFNQADDTRWDLFHQEQAEIERKHQENPGPVMKMTLGGPGEGNADGGGGGDGGGGE